MEKIIVVVNDAEYAMQMVAPMKNDALPTEWVLLVCPPKFTRHVGRWVSRQSLKAWRNQWAQELIQVVKPVITLGGDTLQWQCSQGRCPTRSIACSRSLVLIGSWMPGGSSWASISSL